ncbi:NIPSNAP family protein [Malaciobacter molluscorum LMG 25693]|uniref:NIPSNAP domain-containing protein n=1 Tax=Malaciobacter molluscorum LMG 25693 TaxID=870501 RepID=A0A2G1DLM4_9BACT|nr:NIPSNAP family protein [Malaciobacter molluscorum]AXX92142.1 NIPSNAP domain-containing protein [Malaciobacter molluscorum LMG 25693]PHO19371.1 NIPSNAP family protein [Malaciobacter molluscorum LMG 25693]
MIFEMRTYTIKIGQLNNYIKHFENIGMPIISKYATLIGYWHTEFGELNQVIHIWSYKDLNDRAIKRQELYKDESWLTKFIPNAMLMLEKQESKILNAVDFSPIK